MGCVCANNQDHNKHHKKPKKTTISHRAPLSELPQIELKNKYQDEVVDDDTKPFTTLRRKILFENSKENYEEKIETIKKWTSQSEKFYDHEFPPKIDSIIPNDKSYYTYDKIPPYYIEQYKYYKWSSPHEIYTFYDVFLSSQIDPQNIIQGNLGNCYLLSALSGLCKNYNRLEKIFVNKEPNKIGIFGIKLYKQGIPEIIIIDDQLPVNNNNLAFSSMSINEIWVCLVEKAWAKLNGCYLNTWFGTPSEAFNALVEAPCLYELHEKYIDYNNTEILWGKINDAYSRGWMICTNTEEIKSDKISLQPYHAYCFLDIYYDLTKKNLRLIKLRNLNREFKWNGKYADGSSKWTKELKEEVQYKSIKNGTFFITFKEYIKYFNWTFICKYEDKYFYRFSRHYIIVDSIEEEMLIDNEDSDIYQKKLKKSDNDFTKDDKKMKDAGTESSNISHIVNNKKANLNNMITCFIEVNVKTKCFITLHVPQKRFIKEPTIDMRNYKNPLSFIIIAKFEDGFYKFISSDFVNWEKITLECEFNPGEYHIFSKCYWEGAQNYEIVISTYAQSPIELYKLENYPVDWLEKIMTQLAITKGRTEYFDRDEEKSFFSHFVWENNFTGFGAIYYENNSQYGSLIITLNFHDIDGLRVIGYYGRKLRLVIPPGNRKIILVQFTKAPWLIQFKDYTHDIWFEYPVQIILNNLIKGDKTKRKEIGSEIVLNEINYNRGMILYIENISYEKNFQFEVAFDNINNFIIENHPSEKKLTLQLKSKSKEIINVKCTKQVYNPNFTISYTYKLLEY